MPSQIYRNLFLQRAIFNKWSDTFYLTFEEDFIDV